jgi:hypothetical protein
MAPCEPMTDDEGLTGVQQAFLIVMYGFRGRLSVGDIDDTSSGGSAR